MGNLADNTACDLILINSPLKDYSERPKLNDFTLPTIGLAYIATCAEDAGYKVDLIDAEALGLGIKAVAELVNAKEPRWVGLNLLAPTYRNSVKILQQLDKRISVMLGGHQAKAMPRQILEDYDIPRIDALILGEGETRVVRLLENAKYRTELPLVYWRENSVAHLPNVKSSDERWLAPDLDSLPFVNRKFLPQDPYLDNGVLESAMVASRGCPFDCSFCGAAISANAEVSVRMRDCCGTCLDQEVVSLDSNCSGKMACPTVTASKCKVVGELFRLPAKNFVIIKKP